VSETPRTRPRLIPPELARRIPNLRQSAATALALGALTAIAIVAQAIALAMVVDRSLLHHASLGQVAPELAVVAGALAARALLALAGELSASRTGDRVVSILRGQLLRQTMALGPGWLAGERPGELSLTATRGLHSLHTYFARYLPQAAMAAAIPVILLAWVASQDWLSLVVVVALVFAVPVTMIYFGREASRRSQRQWRRLGSLAARFLQLIEGLPTLRAFGREEQGRREVAAATDGVRQATMRTLRVAFLSALAMDLIAGFGVGFVAMVLGLRLLWGELSLQTAMAVLLVAPEVFVPLRRAGAEFHASTEGQAAVERVLQVLNAPAAPVEALATPPGPDTALGGALRIEALRVDYEHRAVPALDGFTLDVEPGRRVALVGPSGAGKSSVLAVLLGFVTPTGGAVRLGAHSPSDVAPAHWRTAFAWLPQRPYLFTATLADNLRLGAPDAADDRLREVLEAVGLLPLVAGWPSGLQTRLGQGGLTLSAGERQRVALARALLSPAPVLLLDEPTASLDAVTVSALAPAIEPWLSGRTVVVAAHDAVLLTRFDQVITLRSDHPVVPAP
jgi:thiol reductant ABC exporter CydD subunit